MRCASSFIFSLQNIAACALCPNVGSSMCFSCLFLYLNSAFGLVSMVVLMQGKVEGGLSFAKLLAYHMATGYTTLQCQIIPAYNLLPTFILHRVVFFYCSTGLFANLLFCVLNVLSVNGIHTLADLPSCLFVNKRFIPRKLSYV